MRLSALSRVVSQTKAFQRCVNHSPDAQACNQTIPCPSIRDDELLMIRLCKQALTRQDTNWYLPVVIVMTYASAETDDQIHRLTKMELG